MGVQLLNPRQQKFVQAIVEGKTQLEAYKAAGYSYAKMSDENARRQAVKYMRTPRIAQALADARAAAIERISLSADDIVEQLMEARAIALSCEPRQVGAAVAASMGAAKILGHIVEHRQVDITHHKPGISGQLVELSEDEWKRQFAP